MLRNLPILSLLFLFLLVGGCSGGGSTSSDPGAGSPSSGDNGSSTTAADNFTPQPVPEPVAPDGSEQPLYFFLFTHTEDPFNYELSEERYTRLIPEVESRSSSHPDAHLVWSIMFQGTDARSVIERNPQTGVLDLIKAAIGKGVVEMGYHAHHEATYLDRPQVDFTDQTSWGDLVDGMVDWVGCVKDLAHGGCTSPSGGGMSWVQDHIGPLQLVSGTFLQSDVAYEGGPTSHAVHKILPERVLGFGFPDHGVFVEDGHREMVAALLSRLTPGADTSGTLFWADNVLKMNGGNPIDGVIGIDPVKGANFTRSLLQSYDRNRPQLILTGIASKFVYAAESPTVYGYSHPDAPQLPADKLKSTQAKESAYQNSIDTLDFILDEVLPEDNGSRFVKSSELISMVAPADYLQVSSARLDLLARWALTHWESGPPDWVSDGSEYYSLRDLFTLLVTALANLDGTGSPPANQQLQIAYGPLSAVDSSTAGQISRTDLLAKVAEIDPLFAASAAWKTTPDAMLQPSYQTAAGTLSTAQFLYAMAWLYASDQSGEYLEQIPFPASAAMPQTYDLLLDIGCLNTCTGTAWSFKPARLRPPEEGSAPPAQSSSGTIHTLFSLNIQDFSYPDRSAAIITQVLDLHESTNVPIDLYLTDEMAAYFSSSQAKLWQRILDSPVAAVSYHVRPPRPYANNYDWLQLEGMGEEERRTVIRDYETHLVDPITGQTTEESGGFALLTSLLGAAPYAAAVGSGSFSVDASAEAIYAELGAQMLVKHGISATNLGASSSGLPLRPEHSDYRLFEHSAEDAATAFETALTEGLQRSGAQAPYFINAKIHDNDFFASDSAWTTVYLSGSRRPDWDPSLKADLLSASEQKQIWDFYTASVNYVASQKSRITPLNLPRLLQTYADELSP